MRDIREKNWFWLENDLVDRIDLKPMERLLYMVLARHSDNDSGESFPSEDTLCIKTGVKDKRTIRTYIESLEKKGLIKVKRQLGKSNRYFLKSLKVVTKNDTSVVAKNVVTKNDTGNKNNEKVVTNFAETSGKNCHSNYTHKNTNIMNHEEHDFFENLFKNIEVNFTLTNQKSVKKLLKTLSKEDIEKYLLETYENMNSNPDIKNLSGAFSKKIQTGERQPKYQPKNKYVQEEKQEYKPLENQKMKIKIENKVLTQDLIAAEKEEKATLDTLFKSLPKQEQENIMSNALRIALASSNGFEPFAKLMANTKIKYELLRNL
ncbi:MAG: helix-turn-helix domain-containing protein [Cetobacterium sp.]